MLLDTLYMLSLSSSMVSLLFPFSALCSLLGLSLGLFGNNGYYMYFILFSFIIFFPGKFGNLKTTKLGLENNFKDGRLRICYAFGF